MRRLISQPFERLLSQSRVAAVQLQRPDAHELLIVPLVPFGQVAPQAPQFAALVRTSVSQPFPTIESQLPKFALQVEMLHALDAHVAVATCERLAQLLLHAPQFVASLASVVSHPLLALLSQLPRPDWHVRLAQSPLTQLALATPGSALQLLLHPPQAVAVFERFTSQPSPEVLLQFA